MPIPSRYEFIQHSAVIFSRYLHERGLSQREFCKAFKLPERTFNYWMASKEGVVGVTVRGPVKLLERILKKVKLYEHPHVAEALRDVVHYVDRYLRRKD